MTTVTERAAVVRPSASQDKVPGVLASAGRGLDTTTRTLMEDRFGHDFGAVRIHTDRTAARSAARLGAEAYTVGSHVVFGQGRFAPGTSAGRRLLAHELVHVVQQADRPGSAYPGNLSVSEPHESSEHEADRVAEMALAGGSRPPPIHATGTRVARQGVWQRIKSSAYDVIIDGLRAAKRVSIRFLRRLVDRLPDGVRPAGHTIVDVVDAIADLLMGFLLAVIGVIVGFGEGVVGLVTGLITLVRGILSGLYAVVADLLTGSSARTTEWWDNLVTAVKAIPAGLKALFDRWIAEFEAASPERQTLMIGELTGQILALIASFYVAPARVGSGGTLAEAGEVAATTAAAGSRPALTLVRSGGLAGEAVGGAGRVVEVGTGAGRGAAAAFDGTGALRLSEVAEVGPAVAPRPVPTLVPAPRPTPVVAGADAATAGASTGRRVAQVGAVSAATAARVGEEEDSDEPSTMVHQIQLGRDDHYASTRALAPARTGVTALQLRETMAANLQRYLGIARGLEPTPPGWTRGPVEWEHGIYSGIIRQSQRITAVVAGGGVHLGGNVRALQVGFNPRTLAVADPPSNTDVRLDIENRGHNLRT
jgi:hypothetical protein